MHNSNGVASELMWRKSSFSGSTNDCIEVADGAHNVVAVRDSKDRQGPALTFTPSAWRAFVIGVQSGEFQLRR